MLVEDLIQLPQYSIVVNTIRQQCSNYLSECEGNYLTKQLPNTYLDFQKVKVRLHKPSSNIDFIFNEAFQDKQQKLRQRAVITNSTSVSNNPELDTFCVFPINGYRFIYNKGILNSTVEIADTIDVLNNTLMSGSSNDMLTDVLKRTYVSTNLREGIQSNAEVILYGIPYYYVIRASQITNFNLQPRDKI